MSRVLPPPLPQKPSSIRPDELKQRYLDAVRSRAPGVELGAEVLMLIALVLMSLTIVLLPCAVRKFWVWRQWRRATTDCHGRPRMTTALEFAEGAVPVLAVPLMMSSMLRRPQDDPAAALVMMSFDAGDGSVSRMCDIACRMDERSDLSPADQRFVAEMMNDVDYHAFRRRAIPPSLAGGMTVYACDLAIQPELLAGRCVSDELPLIPCMAEPGVTGRIVVMPYWMVEGRETPDDAAEEAFALSLLSIANFDEIAAKAKE